MFFHLEAYSSLWLHMRPLRTFEEKITSKNIFYSSSSRTFSERLMCFQFTSCVKGVIKDLSFTNFLGEMDVKDVFRILSNIFDGTFSLLTAVNFWIQLFSTTIFIWNNRKLYVTPVDFFYCKQKRCPNNYYKRKHLL